MRKLQYDDTLRRDRRHDGHERLKERKRNKRIRDSESETENKKEKK